ncbi:MAG TPA: MMPL family transporter [Bacteroidales bacterium]|nr:MMPL family transporter [Bacteroidales bacterium]HPR57634.1 MMPL family transporter [Bacteroidales bacterium]HRW97033.1 MMPL family transporter [Bacteroidales bacterium]
MWTYLARLILRRRYWNLIIILLLTLFMGFNAQRVSLSYEMTQILPPTDETRQVYDEFKKTFGEDGSVIFIGISDSNFYRLEEFNDWYDLTEQIRKIEGVEGVVSITRLFNLVKNDSLKKFELKPVFEHKPGSQQELDSLLKVVFSLPFYEGNLFNKENHFTMMAITLEKEVLNTRDRVGLIYKIKTTGDIFAEKHDIKVHYSGLPYIRTITAKKIENELLLFVLLSLLIASVILMIFFRNWKIVAATMFIVIINVIWVMGFIHLLGYKITILTGILPPLLIVIVVENCIFLLNKYHHEIRRHGNKIKALTRVVMLIGNANLLTNLTTAAGFAAFIVTGNQSLIEFGLVASISIVVAYLMTLFLIPIFFSFLSTPALHHTHHLEKGLVSRIIEGITEIVQHHRRAIYLITIIITLTGFYGISLLKTTGSIVDDIPHRDPLYKDLLFFEKNIKGVMPLEISINTNKKRGVLQMSTIQKIEDLQNILSGYSELSKPLSIAEVVKFAKQSFYGGNEAMYSLPNNQERNFIMRYMPEMQTKSRSIINSFVDTSMQITRITVQMANIGTNEIQRIKDELTPRINEIFPPDQYDVKITGTSVVFLKGTEYLFGNLLTSLLLALVVISIMMALLFTSARMIVISMIPNLIPQIMTAALMGFLMISVKTSTILIFSIALGISVDNAIHFLSRYRLQLRLNDWAIKISVINALRETGFSMIYSSVVLFFGFSIFTLSSFGGTEALGYLIAFTLLMALLSNLFVLPSLLLSMDKRITTKKFSEPLIEIFDEEIDIELDDLKIEEIDTRGSA